MAKRAGRRSKWVGLFLLTMGLVVCGMGCGIDRAQGPAAASPSQASPVPSAEAAPLEPTTAPAPSTEPTGESPPTATAAPIEPTKPPVPTETAEPTVPPTERPAAPALEQIAVGQTVLGNSIVMEVLTAPDGLPGAARFVLIVGGIHPQEHTGWKMEGGGEGWLTLMRQWLEIHPSEWVGLSVALLDMNPDGVGRGNPNGVDLQRNFGGEECPICAWRETDPNGRTLCDPDGPAPNSEAESQALLRALDILAQQGEVLFAVVLHNQVPPNGLVDSAYCGEGGNPLSCTVAEELARRAGAAFIVRWELYGCEGGIPEGLAGQPPDYLSYVLDIAAADYELPLRVPDARWAEIFLQALLGAVTAAYEIP